MVASTKKRTYETPPDPALLHLVKHAGAANVSIILKSVPDNKNLQTTVDIPPLPGSIYIKKLPLKNPLFKSPTIKSHLIFSGQFFSILYHVPIFPLFYSFLLTMFAGGVLGAYSNGSFRIPDAVTSLIMNYWLMYVVWILPLRATNAITEGNAQADVVNDILISLEKYVHEVKHLKETAVSYDDVVKEAVDLLIYFIQLFNESFETTKLPEPVVNYNLTIMGEMHQGYQILVENRTFHMRQQLSLPRSLHAVCIILVIFFHGVLFPMALFNANEWYALIYSFFSALVSTACLEIAIKEGKPYHNIFVRNANEKVNSLQKRVTRLVKNLYDLDNDKKTPITDFNAKYLPYFWQFKVS